MLVDIIEVKVLNECLFRDEKFGFCNATAKYSVNGELCCGTHVLAVIKRMLKDEE